MKISEETAALISQLDEFSNGKLNFKTELSELLELSSRYKQEEQLANASFSAKALLNIFNLIQRNGANTQGYEKLVQEFQEQLHRATTNVKSLVENAPIEMKEKFQSQFFGQTQDCFAEFLSLCSDLRYLKNWNIDKN